MALWPRVSAPDNVGLRTGERRPFNREAPILFCTAEFWRHRAREARQQTWQESFGRVPLITRSRKRGVAWQARVDAAAGCLLLMSATLANPRRFEQELTALTGRPTEPHWSRTRPCRWTMPYSLSCFPLAKTRKVWSRRQSAGPMSSHFTQLNRHRARWISRVLNVCTATRKARHRQAF